MHVSAKLAKGLMVFDRYRLKRLLGRGGMGIVWLAHDTELEKDIALKFLSENLLYDTTAIRDLKKETRRGMELSHPNIIRVYGFFSNENYAAVAMEYIEGNNLSRLRDTRTGGFFEVDDIAGWTLELCSALHYAHAHAEIVHRDLKPANLMVDHKCHLKIADFGISASLTDAHTRLTGATAVRGTMLYMGPQQLLGQRPCISHDIYSIGATLFDLLTGKPVFHSGDVSLQIRESIPPSIAERREELDLRGEPIPPEWEDTIHACLDKDASRRPRTAAEIISRLGLQDAHFASHISPIPFASLSADKAPVSEPMTNERAYRRLVRASPLATAPTGQVNDTAQTGPVSVVNSGPLAASGTPNSISGLMMALLILCSVLGGGVVAYFAFQHGSLEATIQANAQPLVTTGSSAPDVGVSFSSDKADLWPGEPGYNPVDRGGRPGPDGRRLLGVPPLPNANYSAGVENRAPEQVLHGPRLGYDFALRSSGMVFRWAPPFTFVFGSPNHNHFPSELATTVEFTQGFWLCQYELTQKDYMDIMGENPSANQSPSHPVENVSWYDAMEYCQRLNQKYADIIPVGYAFTLPTQAQYEYASLGGVNGFYGQNRPHLYGWSKLNDAESTHIVGELMPNEFQLYDTVGNVAEWCLDWYADLPGGEIKDFSGPETGELKVVKGGSYASGQEELRAFYRDAIDPAMSSQKVGFRVALAPINDPDHYSPK